MIYKNAKNILPEELISKIQDYVQGEYLYIPIKDKSSANSSTEYKTELNKRNAHIYRRYLEGVSNACLAEMYNLSQSSIRRIIVQQRRGCEFMKDKIKCMLSNWNMENESIKQIYDTTWQIGDKYVLKTYTDEEMLTRNLAIVNTLNSMNIPVGEIVQSVNGDDYIKVDDQYFFLSKKLEGSNLVEISNIRTYGLMLGKIIADLHIAFQKCESQIDFWDNSLLDEMNGWVKENFANKNWSLISKEEYEDVISNLEKYYSELPVQLIHRDVHFGNFLFDKGKFSGYIDFDLSQRNIRVFDLCYFMLGLLSEKDKFKITDEKWLEMLKYVFEGYNNVIPITSQEKQATPFVMECIELLFVSYFHSVDDTILAESAFKIYNFIKENQKKITAVI